MYFNDDGSCNDIDYHGPTSADPVSYKVMSDGKLVFTMEWDGTSSFDLAQSEEEAMNDYHKYYISGDTLIFRKNTNKKVKNYTPIRLNRGFVYDEYDFI